jgi:predicted aconitase
MHMTDHDSRQDCRVIPFVRPVTNEDNVVTSSIAAVIAVTILHYEGDTPEERLLEIIEASGEAEVLDIADVLEEFETLGNAPTPFNRPANDNQYITRV